LVLVADDEGDIRDMVCEMLGRAGFRTMAAGDGDEVGVLAVAHQPVLIVLDVLMPRMDGYTTLTRLQGDPRTQSIPVVMLTGRLEPIYRTLSAGVGAVAHLTKPFSARQLTEAIYRALGRDVPCGAA
jgi:two-component system, OmpR family, phosphate regulon response regulator PhoB